MFTPEQRELARRRAAAIVKKEAAKLGYDAASTRLMTNGASLSVNLAFKAIEGDAAAAGVATAPKTTTKSGGGSKPSTGHSSRSKSAGAANQKRARNSQREIKVTPFIDLTGDDDDDYVVWSGTPHDGSVIDLTMSDDDEDSDDDYDVHELEVRPLGGCTAANVCRIHVLGFSVVVFVVILGVFVVIIVVFVDWTECLVQTSIRKGYIIH